MNRPEYSEFRYNGATDQAAIARVIGSRFSMAAATHEQTGKVEQRLQTFVSTPTDVKGDEVLVRLTEFADENGRPSGAIFDALIAESTGRRVISTNLPGIDFYGDSLSEKHQNLTLEQSKDLSKGSFNRVGGAVLQASLNTLTELQLDPKLVVLGTSMSAGIAASVLNAAREQSIDLKGATFAEPTNMTARSPLKLGAQFVKAGLTAQGYVAMNPEIVREAGEPVLTIIKRAANIKNFLYARALANGSLIQDLGPIDHLEGVPVFMSRGAASTISPEDGFEKLKTHLSHTADVDTVTYGHPRTNPHDHGYVLTVQSFIDAAKNVLER